MLSLLGLCGVNCPKFALAGRFRYAAGEVLKVGLAPRETPPLHKISANPAAAGALVIMNDTSILIVLSTIVSRTSKKPSPPLLLMFTISQPNPAAGSPEAAAPETGDTAVRNSRLPLTFIAASSGGNVPAVIPPKAKPP